MGEDYLDWQKKTSGIKLNDVIEEFKYVYRGQTIKAGDFVNYINGIAGKTDYGESVDTQLSTETNTGYTISAVQLDENRVFIAHSYGSSYYLYGMVVTIDGTNISYSEDTLLSSTQYAGSAISTCLLPSGNVFIAHSGETASYYLYGIVCSISGTTITKGSDTALVNSGRSGEVVSTCLLPNGNIFIAHSYGTYHYLYGIIATIDGTQITYGSDKQLSTTSYTGFIISTVTLDKNRIFIAHSYSTSYYLYGIVCTIDSTTISKGTDTLLKNDSSEGATISTCLLPNGNIFIAHRYGTAAQNLFIYGLICNISGTTITAGTDTALVSSSHAGFTISSLLLNSDTIFIAHYIDSSAYLYAQIFGIDELNNIPTNNIVITEYEQQVTPAIEPPFNAIALSSGVGGTDTEHNEQVKIARVYKEVEVTKLIQGDIIPKTWIEETDTKLVADNGTTIVISSSKSNVANPSSGDWREAFDGNTSTSEQGHYGYNADIYVDITFPTPQKITKMKTRMFRQNPTGTKLYGDIQILGSNDKSSWTELYDISNAQNELTEIELNNTDYYQYYRVYTNSGSDGYTLVIFECQVSEYEATVTEVIQ